MYPEAQKFKTNLGTLKNDQKQVLMQGKNKPGHFLRQNKNLFFHYNKERSNLATF